MAKQHFFLVGGDVDDLDVKSVHVDGFEADDELLELLSLVTDDVYVSVGNVELVFPL